MKKRLLIPLATLIMSIGLTSCDILEQLFTSISIDLPEDIPSIDLPEGFPSIDLPNKESSDLESSNVKVSTPEVSIPEVSTPEVSIPDYSVPLPDISSSENKDSSPSDETSINISYLVKQELDEHYNGFSTVTSSFYLGDKYGIYLPEFEDKIHAYLTWELVLQDSSKEGIVSLNRPDPYSEHCEVIINYTEELAIEDFDFTLNVTIKDDYGHEEYSSYNFTVPKFEYNTWQDVYDSASNSSNDKLTVKGTVIATYKDGIYFQMEDGNCLYAYATAEFGKNNQNGYYANFPVGAEIMVSGTATLYYGNPQFYSGCSVKVIKQPDANYSINYIDRTKEFEAAESASSSSLFEYIYEPISLDITMTNYDETNKYYYFTVGDSTVEYYFRPTNTYNNFTNESITQQVAYWTNGYKATIKGIVASYSGKYYIVPISVNSVKLSEANTTPESAADALFSEIVFDYYLSKDLYLREEEGLNWEVLSGHEVISIKDSMLVVNPSYEDVEATIKATYVYEGLSFEREYLFVVTPINTSKITLTGANLGLSAYASGTISVEGTTYGYTELSDNGSGIQMRRKTVASNEKSQLWNIDEFDKPIKEIVLTYRDNKTPKENIHILEFYFGNDDSVSSYTTKLSTLDGVKVYTVTPDKIAYTFFKMSYSDLYTTTLYWDTIEIIFADGNQYKTIHQLDTEALFYEMYPDVSWGDKTSCDKTPLNNDTATLSWLEVEGSVQLRTNDIDNKLEILKNETGALSYTATGKVKITVQLASTSQKNSSSFALKYGDTYLPCDQDANAIQGTIENKYIVVSDGSDPISGVLYEYSGFDNLYMVYGSGEGITLTWTIDASLLGSMKLSLVSPNVETGRGFRLLAYTVAVDMYTSNLQPDLGVCYSIKEALSTYEGRQAILTGTVYNIIKKNYSNTNRYDVWIKDENGDVIIANEVDSELNIHDIVTFQGTITYVNKEARIAPLATCTLIGTEACTFTEVSCLFDSYCTVCHKVNALALGHTEANAEGVCDRCGQNPSHIIAFKTMAELAEEYGWSSSTTNQEFKLDDAVTIKVDGGANSGKFYGGDHIRIYSTDTPAGSLTISLAEGYELTLIKITVAVGDYALLCVADSTTDICNITFAVEGQAVTLNTIRNGDLGKQVRISEIKVVYTQVETNE